MTSNAVTRSPLHHVHQQGYSCHAPHHARHARAVHHLIMCHTPYCVMQALVILRGLMGVGLGGAPVAFALYLELVPSKYRGALLVALQSFWTVGSMLEVSRLRGLFVSYNRAGARR